MHRTFLIQAASSYAASIARVASWMIVAAVVYRSYCGADELALLMLIRGTVGLLSYAGLGLAPHLVHLLSRPIESLPVEETSRVEYARALSASERMAPKRVFATAFVVVVVVGFVAWLVMLLYAREMPRLHRLTGSIVSEPLLVAMWLGSGTVLRALSDVLSAGLQARGRISADSLCVVLAESVFVGTVLVSPRDPAAESAGLAFLLSSCALLLFRRMAGTGELPLVLRDFDRGLIKPLLAGGALVVLSQLADWLYAPANQVLIDRFLGTREIATYVPAIQVDAALLLLVAGLSTVLLPRAAAAFHSKDVDTLRGYYVTGTVFSIAILAFGATLVCLASDGLFRLWFKDPLPATQAILPLVMIHTVIGGSASIGRSVLFGMGAIKPYAIAAIVGGMANVVLAIVFLTTTDLGLRGIIYATILTVTVRCLIWLPWYTLRTISKCGETSRT